ncbi:hypothetical protein ACFVQB_13685 [Paenibacillus sp. NPDC057886]|uniref:hypothetical protein n=1 Tax=Paenibacillus sp. NPDC057886 TaxID=3346270 RepID=UPI0036CBB6AA
MNYKARTEETIIITKGSADLLCIQIPYNAEHIQRIRQITGRRWEPHTKRWIIPYTIATIQKVTNLFDALHVKIAPGYSRKTIKAYCSQIE